MSKDDVVISKSDLAEMIAAAVKAGADAARAAAPTSIPFNPDEQMRKQIDVIRGTGIEPERAETLRRTSARTGTTFTAIIFRGKVVRLEDVVFSPLCARHVKEGGVVPDGMLIVQGLEKEIMKGDTKLQTPQFRQWFWQQIRILDIRELVGRDVPWLMRQTNEPEVAAAA